MSSTKKEKDAISKYQTFKTERVHRSQLIGADYNPRYMDQDTKGRLKKVIKDLGVVQPPVWNRRTGRVVGGHMRLEALDSLHKNTDYYLDVAVIDVDEKKEKETNLALNNESIMGDFDNDLLKKMFDDPLEIDWDAAGFTPADIDVMFGGELSALIEDDTAVKEAKGVLKDIKEDREKATRKFDDDQSDEFYFVVVCDSKEQKEGILKRLRIPTFEHYVNSAQVLMGLDKLCQKGPASPERETE